MNSEYHLRLKLEPEEVLPPDENLSAGKKYLTKELIKLQNLQSTLDSTKPTFSIVKLHASIKQKCQSYYCFFPLLHNVQNFFFYFSLWSHNYIDKKITLVLLMESWVVVGVASVFGNSFLITTRPITRSSHQVAFISVLMFFKNSVGTKRY